MLDSKLFSDLWHPIARTLHAPQIAHLLANHWSPHWAAGLLTTRQLAIIS